MGFYPIEGCPECPLIDNVPEGKGHNDTVTDVYVHEQMLKGLYIGTEPLFGPPTKRLDSELVLTELFNVEHFALQPREAYIPTLHPKVGGFDALIPDPLGDFIGRLLLFHWIFYYQ